MSAGTTFPWALLLLAVIAGAMLPLQGAVNAQLGRQLDDFIFASFISFVFGSITLCVVLLVRGWPASNWQQLREVPPVLYVGGALGAIYVTTVILLIPKIGVANTLIAIVVGQVLLSLLLDHWGLLNVQVHLLTPMRLLGAVLVVFGLGLVAKF